MDNQDHNIRITEQERTALVDVIYEYLMGIPCLDMIDMGDARHDAEKIVYLWERIINSTNFKKEYK